MKISKHRTSSCNSFIACSWTATQICVPLICSAIALAPLPLYAAGGKDDAVLEEVIVTAQFRAQNLQDTPIAITAVSGELLEARNQTSLANVAAQAPNVVLTEMGGGFGPGMAASIRGIGQSDYIAAMEPGVGVYIDDVYYSSLTGANFGLLDLDRVEILRGPQGTLAGRNSEGGAIKLYSVKPKGDNSGSVALTYGSRHLLEARGVADIPIIGDALFARISAVSHRQKGYVDRLDYGCANPASGIPNNSTQGDCLLGHEGGKSYTAGRVALRWLASDSVEVNLSADVTEDNSEVSAVTLLQALPTSAPNPAAFYVGELYMDPQYPWGANARYLPPNPYTSYASFCGYRPVVTAPFTVDTTQAGQSFCFNPTTDTQVWGANLTVDWRLSDSLAVKSITAYREFDSRWVEDNDVSPSSFALGAEHQTNHSFSQELRLTGKLGRAFDYTVGAYYFSQTTIDGSHQVLPSTPLPASFEFLSHNPVVASSYAGFVNGSWHITDALNLNAGVRYTKEKKDYNYGRTDIYGNESPLFFDPFAGVNLNGQVGRYEGNKIDYRANLDYRWNDNLMTYASVSTGFKGGGTNPRPFYVAQVKSFDPEYLVAYEAGAKTDFLDHRLRVNLSVFLNKYKDMQITLLQCPETSFATPFGTVYLPCARPTNAGDAEIKGAELELFAQPTLGLSFDASYSYLNFKYTRLDPGTLIPEGDIAPGMIRSKYSVGAQYDFAFAGGTLTPRVDTSYQGGYFSSGINSSRNYVPGYHLTNAQVTWRPISGAWSFSVAGKNLFNKLYYTSVFDFTAVGGPFVYGTPAAPREYQAQIQRKF